MLFCSTQNQPKSGIWNAVTLTNSLPNSKRLERIRPPIYLGCIQCVDTPMNSKDIFGLAVRFLGPLFQNIFGLIVRLLGLLFLYFALKGVSPLLDLDVLESPDKNEIINDLMPVVFNLAVALWLIRGAFVRWAYPDLQKNSEPSLPSVQPTPPPLGPTAPPASAPSPELTAELTGMARAEEKLAALVEKPKGN